MALPLLLARGTRAPLKDSEATTFPLQMSSIVRPPTNDAIETGYDDLAEVSLSLNGGTVLQRARGSEHLAHLPQAFSDPAQFGMSNTHSSPAVLPLRSDREAEETEKAEAVATKSARRHTRASIVSNSESL